MQVVVTRPDRAARKTAEKLRALGHQPLLLPLFAPSHDLDAIRAAICEPAAGLVITSAEAIRALTRANADLAPLLDRPLFAVGVATGREAEAMGFRNVRCAAGTGGDLARIVASSGHGWTTPLLYLAGEPRKPDLEDGLARQGIPFRSVTAYRMTPLDVPGGALEAALGTGGKRAILLYSREAALRLQQVAARAGDEVSLQGNSFYCLSPLIAEALAPSLRRHAFISARPDEDALLSLLPAALTP